MTVINHLHASCAGQVEAANVLKTMENVTLLSQAHGDEGNLTESGVYQETIKNQLQAAVVLPKARFFYIFLFYFGVNCGYLQINITLLQVSIVEEIISFSALDNIKDLTCVSMFSVCFDNVTAKFHSDKQVQSFVSWLFCFFRNCLFFVSG